MGEALIIRSGGGYSNGGSNGGSGQYVPMTEIIQENTMFTMPKTQGQQIAVRIFGGGGGYNRAGGGGGNMNYAILNIPAETKVSIIIGDGGDTYNNEGILVGMVHYGKNGGTTTFGNYLSATGGEVGGNGYGGNGGSGGGGRGYSFTSGDWTGYSTGGGGHGTYGGGGGGGGAYSISNSYGGNGGTYGGGGGGKKSNGGISTGGWGNAGNNGFNSIELGLEFEGAGLCLKPGNDLYGGGGYGGNGGSVDGFGCGGGGGYGASGGNGYGINKFGRGGGGGGWGGNGSHANNLYGGGGGGYGLQGFGHGGGGSLGDAMKGVCILSYSKLVES